MKLALFRSSTIAVIFLALLAVPVYAVDNTGVGGKPANPRADNPRSKSIFVYELKPGESVDDAVLLVNSTPDTKTVDVYATDSLVSSGGAFACEQRADELNEAGTWVKLSQDSVELAGGTQKTVPFTLTVPKNVSVGEHNACVAIQTREPAVDSGVNGVQLSFRSAIRIAVTIPGDISKRLDFESIEVAEKNSKLVVTEQLRNRGNVSLDTLLKTTVGGLFGIGNQTVEGEYPVLAGQSAQFNFELRKPFWGGFYSVRSEASYNANPDVSLGDKGGERKTVSVSEIVFVPPQTPALVAYLVIVALGTALLTMRIRTKQNLKTLRSTAVSYVVGKHQTIQQVASLHQTDWKKIATLNKLSPPYELKAGQTLLIPAGTRNKAAKG